MLIQTSTLIENDKNIFSNFTDRKSRYVEFLNQKLISIPNYS